MAQEYIGFYKQIMLDIFPTIDNTTNTALAWGGLHETAGWAQMSTLEQNYFLGINNDHQGGSVGTAQTCY